MLLYTRRAPQKKPKRRSRAGCTYCKEKKKKCNETRPKCSRCAEHNIECTYEAVKPRQRRKRSDPAADATSDACFDDYPSGRRLSEASLASSDFPAGPDDSEDEDAEIEYHESPYPGLGHSAMTLRSRSLFPVLDMIAPCSITSPLMDFRPPLFAEFSDRPNRRALVDHFCNVLSHLIVFREESGNPFQQLVLPLTQQSSPVMNAIYALASAHLEYRGVINTENSLYFHSRAIQGIGRLIQLNDKANRNEMLAAIMLLVYYEVLVQRGHSNIVAGHLKGALTVMCTNPEPLDPTSAFLERAFRFYDVIAALSNGTAPLSAAPAPGCLQPFPPLGAPTASLLSNVDTLLGMATTLWPIIHRLSDMLSLKNELEQAVRASAAASKIAVLRTELESTAEAIETALTQWQPHLPPNFVPDEMHAIDDPTLAATVDYTSGIADGRGLIADHDPTAPVLSATERARLHSILHNALAYRHSAFVYLYRTIYACPRSHKAVQTHAHLALVHCVGTVRYAGPMGALLWPLFAAACEAVGAEDRALAERAFAAIRQRQGMMNIERAWEIVQEVWRRADWADLLAQLDGEREGEAEVGGEEGEEGFHNGGGYHQHHHHLRGKRGGDLDADLWRRVSEEMGVNIVFG